jgi:hypothetical protein
MARRSISKAMKEANRAAMLMNYTESSIVLLQADDTENAGDSKDGDAIVAAADRPALFANLRARQAYAVVGGAGGAGNITLTKVLDSFSFQHEAEREVLQEKILKLKMHDTPISLEQETPAGMTASLRACLHVHLNRHPYMSEQLGGRFCATYTAAKSPSILRQINSN